jgi:hypothetical protein
VWQACVFAQRNEFAALTFVICIKGFPDHSLCYIDNSAFFVTAVAVIALVAAVHLGI